MMIPSGIIINAHQVFYLQAFFFFARCDCNKMNKEIYKDNRYIYIKTTTLPTDGYDKNGNK